MSDVTGTEQSKQDPWFVHPTHVIGGAPYCVNCGAALPGGTLPSRFRVAEPCMRTSVESAMANYRPASTLTAKERAAVVDEAMNWLKKPGNAEDPAAPWFAAYEATDAAIHGRERADGDTWSREHDWNQ